jgi:hypothetical protein
LSRDDRVTLALCVGVALAFRITAAVSFPVVFDEVDVLAYGVARGLERGGLLFEIPLAVSNGITPLWFWLQTLPALWFGATKAAGLRSLPVALGVASTWLAYRITEHTHGRRAAALAGLIVATGGPFVYTNALGQFSESLLVPLLLVLLCDLVRVPPGNALPGIRTALWPSLMLLTYLGKGLLVYAAYALTLVLSVVFLSESARGMRTHVPRLFALLVLPVIPSAIWLGCAQVVTFGGAREMRTDWGSIHNVAEAVVALTLGYGSQVKGFMTGRPWDALYVFRDPAVWPTLDLLAPALLATIIGLARDLGAAVRGRRPEAVRRALIPLSLATPVMAVVVGKGLLDARFHLLYLPVLIPELAARIDAWLQMPQQGRWREFAAWGAATVFYVSATWALVGGGSAPGARLGASAMCGSLVLVAVAAWARRGRGGWGPTGAAAAVIVASGLVGGPLWWGRRWAWEPGPHPHETPRAVSSFPDVTVQLARRALEREGVARARRWILEALERHDGDRTTLLDLGPALIDGSPADATRVAFAAEDYVRRHPDDVEVRALRQRALAAGRVP